MEEKAGTKVSGMNGEYRICYLGNVVGVARALARIPGVCLTGCIYEDMEDAQDFITLGKTRGVRSRRITSQEAITDVLSEFGPVDLGVIANFGRILDEAQLKLTTDGFINAHPGLLPQNPGRYPVKKSLERQDKVSGITLHWAQREVDCGEVIDCSEIQVQKGLSATELCSRLYALVPDILMRNIPSIISRRN